MSHACLLVLRQICQYKKNFKKEFTIYFSIKNLGRVTTWIGTMYENGNIMKLSEKRFIKKQLCRL